MLLVLSIELCERVDGPQDYGYCYYYYYAGARRARARIRRRTWMWREHRQLRMLLSPESDSVPLTFSGFRSVHPLASRNSYAPVSSQCVEISGGNCLSQRPPLPSEVGTIQGDMLSSLPLITGHNCMLGSRSPGLGICGGRQRAQSRPHEFTGVGCIVPLDRREQTERVLIEHLLGLPTPPPPPPPPPPGPLLGPHHMYEGTLQYVR